jgi:DNA-binding transcriptional ArsR family regulator
MRELLAVSKALSDVNRVRALAALAHGELCVCQIVELLQLAPSTVSKHLSLLERAQLVERRRNGRWVHYRRPGGAVPPSCREALRWVDSALAKDAQIRDDAKRLRRILKVPVEELCSVEGRRR